MMNLSKDRWAITEWREISFALSLPSVPVVIIVSSAASARALTDCGFRNEASFGRRTRSVRPPSSLPPSFLRYLLPLPLRLAQG